MGMSNVATGSAPLFAAAIGGIVLDVVSTRSTDATGARAAFLVGVGLFLVAAVLLRPVVEPPRGGPRRPRPRRRCRRTGGRTGGPRAPSPGLRARGAAEPGPPRGEAGDAAPDRVPPRRGPQERERVVGRHHHGTAAQMNTR